MCRRSGNGSPAIVTVWFAWWYLRPTTETPCSALLTTARANGVKLRSDALASSYSHQYRQDCIDSTSQERH